MKRQLLDNNPIYIRMQRAIEEFNDEQDEESQNEESQDDES